MYTKEYYPDTKKSEMKLFAATWMQTEVTIQGEQIRETKTNIYAVTYMWNLK